jgi:DeoR/GlpR family transcriptional regulator of sugar metabolism
MMASKNKPRIKTPKNVPEMHINIFSTLNEAVADLKALGQAFDIPEATIRQELRELKDDVAAMRGVRVKPTRTTR